MKRLSAAIAFGLSAALVSSVLAKDALYMGLYLVEFSDPPALRYSGGIGELRGTAPKSARGRFDSADPAASAYLAHLSNRQAEALEQCHQLKKSPQITQFSSQNSCYFIITIM